MNIINLRVQFVLQVTSKTFSVSLNFYSCGYELRDLIVKTAKLEGFSLKIIAAGKMMEDQILLSQQKGFKVSYTNTHQYTIQ